MVRAEFRYAVAVPPRELPKLSDPRMLRGIAHPMRNRILEEMSAGGPMRAADVAERLNIPANQASFHLRQLAKYGLVEEAPELARDGRDRVWRAAHESGLRVNLEEIAKEAGGKAAITVFRRQWTADAHAAIDRADRPERNKDAMVAVSTHAVRLTKAEAQSSPARSTTSSTDGGRRARRRSRGAPTRCSGCSSPRPSCSSRRVIG